MGLIILSNEKAKGGFVLCDSITQEVRLQGTFEYLTEAKERLLSWGYGLSLVPEERSSTLFVTTDKTIQYHF